MEKRACTSVHTSRKRVKRERNERIGKSAIGDGRRTRVENLDPASHSFRETGTTKDEIYVARLRDNRGSILNLNRG